MVEWESIKRLDSFCNLAVILGGGFGGVAAARELGRHRIPTLMLSTEEYVVKSKYSLGVRVKDTCEIVEFLSRLPEYVSKKPVLFTDNDLYLHLIYENLSLLKDHYLFPAHPNNLRLNDKFLLFESARSCGVKAPETYTDIEQVPGYPVIVKPAGWMSHACRLKAKAFYCRSRAEALEAVGLLNRHNLKAVSQQIIPGDTQDLYVVTLYRNSRGEILPAGVIQKIREYPRRYGTGTSHLTVNLPELVQQGIRMLDAVDYRGIAELEFKYDKNTGEFYIIEVNGRLPLEIGIFRKTGSRFIYRVYLDLISSSEKEVFFGNKGPVHCAAIPSVPGKEDSFQAEQKPVLWAFFLKDVLASRSLLSLISDYLPFLRPYQIQWAAWDKSDLRPFLYYNKHLLHRLLQVYVKPRERTKRLIDILGSLTALLVFSPLMAVIALFILLSDPGPVIFRQKRLGLHGRKFTMYKFRSMVVNAEEILRKDKSLYDRYVSNYHLDEDEDPRVTRIGRFLRNTSLDELPQFFNVLRGQMSLVGPRPIVGEELVNYGDRGADFLSVKPGLTGHWQVSGRDNIPYPQRVEVEMYYVSHHNLWLDMKIIFNTFRCVFQRKTC
jgi:exopolysaccharide production protein ExoY